MRVDRAFGFVDLCGFTSFADRHGDEQVVLMLALLRTRLRETAARRGVRVAKWLGDGAMLSATDDGALVALVVEIAERLAEAMPALPLRAGMATGPVIMFEGDDYIGYPVNVAARLCQQAAPGQLLATAELSVSRPAWVSADSATTITVRGLEAPIHTQALYLQDPGVNAVIDPVCGLRIASAHAVVHDKVGYCSVACSSATSGQTRDDEALRVTEIPVRGLPVAQAQPIADSSGGHSSPTEPHGRYTTTGPAGTSCDPSVP